MCKRDPKTASEVSRFLYFLGVVKQSGALPIDYLLPFEESLLKTLLEHFGSKYAEVLDELLFSGELRNIFSASYNPETGNFDTTLLISYLTQRFNSLWANEVKATVEDTVEEMWYLGTEYMQHQADDEYEGEEIDLDEEEERYVAQITAVVLGSMLGGAIEQIILPVVTQSVESGFLEGLSSDEVYDKLIDSMGTSVPLRADSYYDMLSTTSINLSRNMGRIYQASVLQIEYLVWQTAEDEKVCAICAPMNGKRFPVSGLKALADSYEAAETIEQVKEQLPWPKVFGDSFRLPNGEEIPLETSGEELIEYGIGMPPLHGHCRCEVNPE